MIGKEVFAIFVADNRMASRYLRVGQHIIVLVAPTDAASPTLKHADHRLFGRLAVKRDHLKAQGKRLKV